MPGGALRGSGLPIALKLITLLMTGWILTLAVTAALVVVLPPPAATSFRLSEVADALRGSQLSQRDARLLQRSEDPQPPAPGERRMTSGIYRLALASALGLPVTRVRLERYPSTDPVRRFLLRALATPVATTAPPGFAPDVAALPADLSSVPADLPPTASGPSRPVGPLASLRWPLGSSAALPSSQMAAILDRIRPLMGRFAVAIQESSGQWTVVTPKPEPFPSPWQQRVMLWFFACLGVLAPVGYAFARHFTAPIGLFASAAERLGRDPATAPMELTGPPEIDRAAAAFNEMQARLQRYVEHRTAMVGAIAHDLRTPLARIRFKMEGLPAATREALGQDVQQMEQMIAAALAFVRDARDVRPRELIDLGSLVQSAVDNAALMGADARVGVVEPIVLHADALGLDRLLSNLIDNAVKYGGCARVGTYHDAQTAVIEVRDNGPGLPAAELERVFEPFYRLEPSRNPGTGGMGLGLAVARSVARSHGGDIELVNDRRGLIARVRLPLPPGSVSPPTDSGSLRSVRSPIEAVG